MDTISKQFARKLDLYFRAHHGKQKEVAAALGWKPPRLNQYVKGGRGTSEDGRLAICRQIGVDYHEFLNGSGSIPEQVDPELEKFVELYKQYGHPSLLSSTLEKLLEIKRIVESS